MVLEKDEGCTEVLNPADLNGESEKDAYLGFVPLDIYQRRQYTPC